jgi:hypothetical protein
MGKQLVCCDGQTRLNRFMINRKKGLECRRKYCQPVGAWFSQLGQLNVVHHMWVFPDLETRKESRAAAWQEKGWAETVWNTGNGHVYCLNEISSI